MSELRPWSNFDRLVDELAALQSRARDAAARSVDEILTLRSWLIGVWIVAFEQDGADRARYGDDLLNALATAFKRRGVAGLGASNLKNFRQLALTWPRLGIRQTPSGESAPALPAMIRQMVSAGLLPSLPARSETLPWQDDAWHERLRRELSFSHLLELSRVQEPLARAFYEVQVLAHRWSVRELKRQRDSMLFERIGLSKDKDAVLALAEQGRLLDTPTAIVRDHYVLEFLGLSERDAYSEADLEAALLDHLQAFLLELGGDFAFLGRQHRITVGGRHHFIDLLFFHRRLRCLIAVDLKIGRFGHEDAGQMNFYLSYLRDNIALEDEGLPVGIILCADKDAEEVHYATGTLDNQVFVSRYLTRLPTEERLRVWLAEEKERLARWEQGE
jgi:predicted nuclease of restriction endonuclease-like (RecB) superfamily